jgi:hypothetical protein
MPERTNVAAKYAFVVLRKVGADNWQFLGEIARRPGTPGRVARSLAIAEATRGQAKRGEIYAALPRSEWRLAQVWSPKDLP